MKMAEKKYDFGIFFEIYIILSANARSGCFDGYVKEKGERFF